MTRPAFFLWALSALVALASAAPAAEPARRPNVILILADDLGWADLGCYGSTYHRTPHLDRLAQQGMRFTDAYAAASICSPTRASILTGQYPARLNLTDWLPGRADRPDQKLLRPVINNALPANIPTLPAALKKAGYVTGQIGKWHLGGRGAAPTDRGFDFSVAGDQAGSPLSYFAPFRSPAGRFIPGLEQAPEGQYLTDRLTDEATRFIRTNRDRPFFLYLAHYAVHIPLRAKKEMIARYRPGQPGAQGNPIYAAMLESLDEGVGRVLAQLDELKLSDHTMVIFTSDNGGLCIREGPDTPATSNAPLREGKGYLYEGGIREPLIVRWPGVTRPGSTTAEPVCSIDLMPTLLEACAASSEKACDGVSLVPLLRGDPLPERALHWHYPHYSNQGGKPSGAIRHGDLKLIEFYESGRRELYNLRNDPREAHNLAGEMPDRAAALAAELADWRRQVGARMPTPNPNFVPNPQAKDGSIALHARTADVHGDQLRFEPQPHKDTLGYWTSVADWASWEFTVRSPGKFNVAVLQGCGKGQGGSLVRLTLGDQDITFTVEDTGHFQNFKARDVGTLTIAAAGRHVLKVTPVRKSAAAVMDLRQVTLKPAP